MDKMLENLEEQKNEQTMMDMEEEAALFEDEMMDQAEDEGMSFSELYEQSISQPREGELITGTVVQVGKENVMVDIGYKSDGRIPISEFLNEEGQPEVKVGDEIEVILERHDGDMDDIILSKEKAKRIKVWDNISQIYNDDGVINGKIVSRVKGGLAVDIGVTGFLPGSQVDLRPVKDLDSLVGQSYDFKILKYNKRRDNVVLSRRVLLEDERDKKKSKTIEEIEPGREMMGVVKNITDYGAFIDLGGLDGLLHITDMSWGRVNHPSELVKIGDEINVKILSFNQDTERVSLGLKQMMEDPWIKASDAYTVGAKVMGKVVSLTDYGAFVEIEEGIEGLIHVSEMSWTRKIRNPAKVLSVGDHVECMVLALDIKDKRISLGMKQVEPNPWDVVAEKYPVGTTIEGKIKNITDFGLFIGIAEGIDGLVHVSDISWTKRVKHPSELYKKGDEIQAVVLKIDKENERFSLGVKQLEVDPWELIPTKYPVNSRTTGTVTNITDFGLFIELEEGIEGLVHISEVGRIKGKSLKELYSLGDVISAKVINISVGDRKIGLSIKRMKKEEERSFIKDYTNKGQSMSSSGLGSQLAQALERANLSPQEAEALAEEFEPSDNGGDDLNAAPEEVDAVEEASAPEEEAPAEETASTEEEAPVEKENEEGEGEPEED